MKCKRCNRILDESKKGMRACAKCGLPYFIVKGIKAVEEKKNNEIDEQDDDSLEEIEEIEE